jgi:hypothetical protein
VLIEKKATEPFARAFFTLPLIALSPSIFEEHKLSLSTQGMKY